MNAILNFDDAIFWHILWERIDMNDYIFLDANMWKRAISLGFVCMSLILIRFILSILMKGWFAIYLTDVNALKIFSSSRFWETVIVKWSWFYMKFMNLFSLRFIHSFDFDHAWFLGRSLIIRVYIFMLSLVMILFD